MAKPLQGEDPESPDLLKCLPAPDSSQQPDHHISCRAAAQEQEPAQELPLSHTQCPQFAPLALKPPEGDHEGKTPSPFGTAQAGDSKGKRNNAECFRLQVAVVSSSHTSLSRDPRSSFDSKPSIIRTAKQPHCQTGVNLTFSVQCINGVNFLVTLFN